MNRKTYKNSKLIGLFLVLGLVLTASGCTEDTYPRPKGYPRIILPEMHEYQTFKNENCPFSFEYPSHGKIIREVADSCIFDLYFPDYDFKWHITYRSIANSGKPRRQHEDEYRDLVMKHVVKLDNLVEQPLESPQGWGILYEMYGELGAPSQVIFGDTAHLFMASFYFDQAVNQDSLQPLINWVREDLYHIAKSVRWTPADESVIIQDNGI